VTVNGPDGGVSPPGAALALCTPRSAPSYFLDPWQYGLRCLKPCDDGPPTVAQASSGRASAGGRGISVESEAASSSSEATNVVTGGRSRTFRQAASPSLSPASTVSASLSPEQLAAVKDRRKLLKKLRQIAGLKQRLAEGGRLDSQQIAKLETEPALRAALEDREVSLVAAGVTLSPGGLVDSYGSMMPALAI